MNRLLISLSNSDRNDPFNFQPARVRVAQWIMERYSRNPFKNLNLLDVGCGRNPISNLTPFAGRWTSLDTENVKKSVYFGTFIQDNALSITIPARSFDCICMIAVLHYQNTTEQCRLINNAKNWLKGDGDLFLYALTPQETTLLKNIQSLTRAIDKLCGSKRIFTLQTQSDLESTLTKHFQIFQKVEDDFSYNAKLYQQRFNLPLKTVEQIFKRYVGKKFFLKRTLYWLKPVIYSIIFRNPISSKDYENYYRLRHDILQKNLPKNSEKDNDEPLSYHLGVWNASNKIVGTGRINLMKRNTGLIRQVALLPELRGKGIGKMIMELLETRVNGIVKQIFLTAQNNAVGFFRHLGYLPLKRKYHLPYEVFHDVTPMIKIL